MNEFSRAFLAAYDRMPQWRRDQVDASLREFIAALERMAALMERWEHEGITAAEQYANPEDPS